MILDYLDKAIDNYYRAKQSYPSAIVLNKRAYDVLFEALDKCKLDISWRDFRDNYKNIPIRIEEIEQIRLE